MLDYCRELVAIAKAGMQRLHGAAELLEPLERIVTTGRTLADDIAAEHARVDGDVRKMIEFLRLR
jgi:hypothetical protein